MIIIFFPTCANFDEPSNQEDIFVVDTNGVSLYNYDDPLDAPFIPKAYPCPGESNYQFIKKINVEGRLLKVCPRCERYYDEVRLLLANLWKKERKN